MKQLIAILMSIFIISPAILTALALPSDHARDFHGNLESANNSMVLKTIDRSESVLSYSERLIRGAAHTC